VRRPRAQRAALGGVGETSAAPADLIGEAERKNEPGYENSGDPSSKPKDDRYRDGKDDQRTQPVVGRNSAHRRILSRPWRMFK
jgi:hypothetical protein